MTTVIRRPAGVLAVLTVAGLLAAGCSSGPSQVGSAVIVGDTAVSVDQVQRELTTVVASQPTAKQNLKEGKLDETARNIVTMHVLHQLVTRAAADNGLAVSDQQVDQLINQTGGIDKVAATLSTDPANARDAVRDVLLEVALAKHNADSLQVAFDYVIADTRQDAERMATQIAADPKAIDGLINAANAKAARSGQQQGAGGKDQQLALGEYLQQPGANILALFGASANTVVTFQPSPQNPQWIVAYVKGRYTYGSQTSGNAASQADLGTLQSVGVALLQPVATQLGVRISPRYGVWDRVAMAVAPSAAQSAGLEIPVRTARP